MGESFFRRIKSTPSKPESVVEPLDVAATINVVRERIGARDPREEEIVTLRFGNSGLRLKCSDRYLLDKNEKYAWEMHFTPESKTKPTAENRLKYSRMFAAGFVSMTNTLTSEDAAIFQDLSKITAQHPMTRVEFNTNDTMWEFVSELIGKKYFKKVDQDFSNIAPGLRDLASNLLDTKGWPGEFLLSDFLAAYQVDPTILDRCRKLADDKKLSDIKVAR